MTTAQQMVSSCINKAYLEEMQKAIEAGLHTREDFGLCPDHMQIVGQRARQLMNPIIYVGDAMSGLLPIGMN